MIWRDWNKADKTLLCAAAVFLFSLCLHLQYRESLLAEGFLFCAEAALVGGIADWFAVTALFRKPLGFPYHTAILPRRREAFIKASVTMVQKEFFSRRKIIHHIEKLHVLPMLMDWLHEPATRQQMLQRLMDYAKDFLMNQDRQEQVDMIAGRLRNTLLQASPDEFLAEVGKWMRESGRDKEFLQYVAMYVREYLEQPATKTAILGMLEQYEKECTKSTLELLLAGIAEALDFVNLEEAAEIMQKQLLRLADELAEVDSPLQRGILALFYEKAEDLGKDPEFRSLIAEMKEDIVRELPLNEAVSLAMMNISESFGADSRTDSLPALRKGFLDIFSEEYARCLEMVHTDGRLRHTVEHFLYDIVVRSALHAQNMVGEIVEDVLRRMTDEQLNHLVYDKVEPDLLWIRMNGSIVGSGIGAVLFVMLVLARS